MSGGYPLADLALARRLERAEALGNARFVEGRPGVSRQRSDLHED